MPLSLFPRQEWMAALQPAAPREVCLGGWGARALQWYPARRRRRRLQAVGLMADLSPPAAAWLLTFMGGQALNQEARQGLATCKGHEKGVT